MKSRMPSINEGKDPNRDEMYRYIAVNHGYDPDEAIHKLKEGEYKQAAYYDFALARQLQITSFPAAIVQTGELNFYLAAKGYTDYDTLQLRISNILHETGNT
ncbi:MAG TPA: DsbA family protein [Sphingobacteriaceae bacterium]